MEQIREGDGKRKGRADVVRTPTKEPGDSAPVRGAESAGFTAHAAPPREDPSSERLHASRPWRPKGRR